MYVVPTDSLCVRCPVCEGPEETFVVIKNILDTQNFQMSQTIEDSSKLTPVDANKLTVDDDEQTLDEPKSPECDDMFLRECLRKLRKLDPIANAYANNLSTQYAYRHAHGTNEELENLWKTVRIAFQATRDNATNGDCLRFWAAREKHMEFFARSV